MDKYNCCYVQHQIWWDVWLYWIHLYQKIELPFKSHLYHIKQFCKLHWRYILYCDFIDCFRPYLRSIKSSRLWILYFTSTCDIMINTQFLENNFNCGYITTPLIIVQQHKLLIDVSMLIQCNNCFFAGIFYTDITKVGFSITIYFNFISDVISYISDPFNASVSTLILWYNCLLLIKWEIRL